MVSFTRDIVLHFYRCRKNTHWKHATGLAYNSKKRLMNHIECCFPTDYLQSSHRRLHVAMSPSSQGRRVSGQVPETDSPLHPTCAQREVLLKKQVVVRSIIPLGVMTLGLLKGADSSTIVIKQRHTASGKLDQRLDEKT